MLAVLLVALESDEDRQKFIETFEQYHARMERTANASTGKSLLVKTRLSEGILAILDGVYDEMLSCRASTYSDPGWATMVIQGRYRVSDVR